MAAISRSVKRTLEKERSPAAAASSLDWPEMEEEEDARSPPGTPPAAAAPAPEKAAASPFDDPLVSSASALLQRIKEKAKRIEERDRAREEFKARAAGVGGGGSDDDDDDDDDDLSDDSFSSSRSSSDVSSSSVLSRSSGEVSSSDEGDTGSLSSSSPASSDSQDELDSQLELAAKAHSVASSSRSRLGAAAAAADEEDEGGPSTTAEGLLRCGPWAHYRLIAAASDGDMDGVRDVIAAGVDVDEPMGYLRRPPLFWAELGGQPEVADYLRGLGAAELDEDAETALVPAGGGVLVESESAARATAETAAARAARRARRRSKKRRERHQTAQRTMSKAAAAAQLKRSRAEGGSRTLDGTWRSSASGGGVDFEAEVEAARLKQVIKEEEKEEEEEGEEEKQATQEDEEEEEEEEYKSERTDEGGDDDLYGANSSDELEEVVPTLAAPLPASPRQPLPPGSPEVLTESGWRAVAPGAVRRGHVVRVPARGTVPADLVMLGAADGATQCYLALPFVAGRPDGRLREAAPVGLPAGALEAADDDPAAFVNDLRARGRLAVAAGGPGPRRPLKGLRGSWHAFGAPAAAPLRGSCLLAARGELLLTDWAAGVAAYAGLLTRFAACGGENGAARRKARREARDARRKARKEAERAAAPAPAEPRDDEGGLVRWRTSYTDVADDGNCMVSAVWLGLGELLRLYPELRLDGEEPLSPTPEAFRADLFARLARDRPYLESVKSLFQLFVEGLEEAWLLGMEDFYVLPDGIRERILAAKRRLASGEGGGAAVDYDAFVSDYVAAASSPTPSPAPGRPPVYVPLGGCEVASLARLYRVDVRTVSSSAAKRACNASSLDGVDPRAVPESEMRSMNPQQQLRQVRLLNVDGNHYQVHLPRPRDEPAVPPFDGDLPEYNDVHFWSPSWLNDEDLEDL